MALSIFCALLSLLATLTSASTNNRQAGLQDAHEKGTRIAIIGAGISCASTAYHLRKNIPPDLPLSITIFDSSERIGGRVASFVVPDTQNKTILETGITSFFADGSGYWPLGQHREPTRTGVWDGTTITGKPLLVQRLREWLDKCGLLWLMEPVLWSHHMSVWDTLRLLHWSNWWLDPGVQASCELASPTFWRRMQLRFEYGRSPRLFRQALSTTNKRLQDFANEGGYRNVAVELERVGLKGDITKTSAAQYLTDIGVSKPFQCEVVEPCVRARFSLDLTQVRAIDAFMACKESKELFIEGGNVQLVEAMVNTSQADVQLRSEVVGIERGQDRRYKLSIADAPKSASHHYREFDIVVLTGPLHGRPMLNSLAKLSSLPRNLLSSPNHIPSSRGPDHYTVIGECFVYGVQDGNMLLGPLPSPWVGVAKWVEGDRRVLRFLNTGTQEVSAEDPRLHDDDLDGWERTSKLLDGDDPINYDFFRHKDTGEVINYDPRLEPEKLEKRGVKLEWFSLV